jgi:osmotically-inducible protein OsmY
LSADASIATQPIQPSVLNGVVTLNGNVSNDTARTTAAEDTTKVGGVKEVVNAITIPNFRQWDVPLLTA